MILYLLKSIACLLILMLVYRLFLQREAMYQFTRFYLIASVVASFLIPLLLLEKSIPLPEIVPAYPTMEETKFLEANSQIVSQQVSFPTKVMNPAVDWQTDLGLFFWGLYGFGVLWMGARFTRHLLTLRSIIRRNPKVDHRGFRLVLVEEQVSPFSFFDYIFYTKADFEKSGIPDAILLHEGCHVRQRHSWDIFLIEILLIFCWFHPGLYLARKAIRLNHEFIADEAALQHLPLRSYQEALFTQISLQSGIEIASNLHHSFTIKRLKMMIKQTSKFRKWALLIGIVPVLAVVIYGFAGKRAPEKDLEMEFPLTESNLQTMDVTNSQPSESQKNGVVESIPVKANESISASHELGSEDLQAYVDQYGKYNTKLYKHRFLSNPQTAEIEALLEEFELLQKSYSVLSVKEKMMVSKANFPFARLEKEGTVIYKKWEDLTEEEKKSLNC